MVSSFLFPSHFEISKIDLVIDLFGIGVLTKRKLHIVLWNLRVFFGLKKKKKNTPNIYTHIYRVRLRYNS